MKIKYHSLPNAEFKYHLGDKSEWETKVPICSQQVQTGSPVYCLIKEAGGSHKP